MDKEKQRELLKEIIQADEKDGLYDLYEENYERVGDIGNYYGGLSVAKIEDSYYWAIENYDGFNPEEITKDLYYALIAFKTKEIIQADEKDDWDVTLNDGLNDIIEDIIDIIDSENSGQSAEQRLDSIKKYLKTFNTKEK